MKRRARARLKVLRAERERTQAHLARLAGTSQTRVCQIENGEGHAPTPREQQTIAAALGVTVAEIDWPVRA